MEVILKKDIEGLGNKNDIIAVKNGYGRNYLIPKGLAILATISVKKVHEENLRQRAHKEEKIKKEAEKLAEQLKGTALKIGTKTSSKGKIFGSVTNIQIADAIKKLGFDLDRRNITIKEEAVKEVGDYNATIKLHRDISVDITFEVVAE